MSRKDPKKKRRSPVKDGKWRSVPLSASVLNMFADTGVLQESKSRQINAQSARDFFPDRKAKLAALKYLK
jgi:hypothetical protein